MPVLSRFNIFYAASVRNLTYYYHHYKCVDVNRSRYCQSNYDIKIHICIVAVMTVYVHMCVQGRIGSYLFGIISFIYIRLK